MIHTLLATSIGLLSLSPYVRAIGVKEFTEEDFVKGIDWWKYRDTVPDDEDSYLFVLFYHPKDTNYTQLREDWRTLGTQFNHAKGNLMIGQFDCSQPMTIDICKEWYRAGAPKSVIVADNDEINDLSSFWTPLPTLVWWDEKKWEQRAEAQGPATYHHGEKYLMKTERMANTEDMHGGAFAQVHKFLVPDFPTIKAFSKKYLEGIERHCNVAKKEACNVKMKEDGTPEEVLSKDGCCLPEELTYLTQVQGLDSAKLEAERTKVKASLDKDPMTQAARIEKEGHRKMLTSLIKANKKGKQGKKEL